ncbi:MAG: amidase [Cyclobacteriaceae bacterium]|jgi:amidase
MRRLSLWAAHTFSVLVLAACHPVDEAHVMDYAETDITTLQAQMAAGELTARVLTQYYLDRISRLDQQGPALNAVIEVNPDALQIADGLDQARSLGQLRGPLHGIPVLLKANIDTHDQMATTAGSVFLKDHHAAADAFIVKRLRDAGAIILGKTNLSEWANFRSNSSSSGWSSLGGQTHNPYDPRRNPCGSSSGSAVAVAAGLASVAVGTETDGSIMCPSSKSGIVGIKPSLGLVSRRGIIPIAHSQDTAGPMGRTVRDAALLYAVMIGEDTEDVTAPSFPGQIPELMAALDDASLQGRRIGVLRNYAGAGTDERVEQIFTYSIALLRQQGAVIIDDLSIDRKGMGNAEFEVLLYEFKSNLNAYLESISPQDGTTPQDLAAVITYNQQHSARAMPFFGQDILVLAQAKGPLTEHAYIDALQTSKSIAQEGINQALQAHQLDAIIAPTGGPAWLTDHINGDRPGGISSSSLAAISGYPAVTVPAGMVEGLPVGLSFFGADMMDAKLIGLAHAFELVSAARVAPDL